MIWAWRFIIPLCGAVVSRVVYGSAASAGLWNLQGCFMEYPIINHTGSASHENYPWDVGVWACEHRKSDGIGRAVV